MAINILPTFLVLKGLNAMHLPFQYQNKYPKDYSSVEKLALYAELHFASEISNYGSPHLVFLSRFHHKGKFEGKFLRISS